MEHICENCGNTGMFLCSGCFRVRYCSPKCQHEHWMIHKKLCTCVDKIQIAKHLNETLIKILQTNCCSDSDLICCYCFKKLFRDEAKIIDYWVNYLDKHIDKSVSIKTHKIKFKGLFFDPHRLVCNIFLQSSNYTETKKPEFHTVSYPEEKYYELYKIDNLDFNEFEEKNKDFLVKIWKFLIQH